MLIASFAGAGLAALVAAGTALAATAPEAKLPNPLLAPWSGPYGGVPPFEKVKVEDFKPALETAMADALAEIDKVASDPAPPTFENTIAGLERSGRALDRVSNIFGIYSSTMSTPDFQKVEEEMAPKLAAFSDQITQNEKLFKRIAAVYDAREKGTLTAEQKRLVWLDYTNFVRAGAKLDAVAKKRMSEINQRLASLYTKFSQNLLADETDYVLFLDKESDLAGLPESLRSGAAAAAEQRGQKGKWAITNTRSSMEPFLTYSDRRDLREKVWKTYYSRGDHGDAKDNNAIITEILKLREGMFWVAGQLFGFQFTPVTDVAVYQPDVRVYKVTDPAGKQVGLWYFDPSARRGKQSGAWMNAYRSQERFEKDITTIVSNNTNFVKGKPGEPILISWDDATALFHEFGHALHGLSSNVTYPSLAGTAVARDYVEFPSQLLERWLSTPEVLNRFALHYQTGKPIPAELVQKIEKASTFNQGFATVEYLASALVDMKLHLAGDQTIDPDKFEKDTLAALGMPSEIVMRHRTPQFGHVFSGDGYSAGYYSYIWSDTLSADAWEAFTAGGGAYDKAVAKRLRDDIFSIGNTVDPAEAYKRFRGREPGIAALMRKRGFPVPADEKTE